MESFTRRDLAGATFTQVDLSGARFAESDLSGAVLRGVSVGGMEIDAPWLTNGDRPLLVNGIDVAAYVDQELDRLCPGRELRRAADPEGLRGAWAALERSWGATLGRVAALPPDTVDVSVAGEWSFAQTLRHLVLATDMWLGKAVLGREQPFHPLGLIDVASAGERDLSVFATETPTFEAVLEARADRVGMVRDFIAAVTPEELAVPRPNPHDPEEGETTLSCLHVILEEEWEHHRYAVRDLDAIAVAATR